MSQDPQTWCDHERGVCVLGRPDDADAHAQLADTVAELDEQRAELFPALLGVDDLTARAAAADWLDTIRISLTGDDTTEDYGTGNYLLTNVLMRAHLDAHGLDVADDAEAAVYAHAWFAIGAAAATAEDERLRLEPAAITHIRYRPQAAALLAAAADMLRKTPADNPTGPASPTRPTAPIPHRPLLHRQKLTAALKEFGAGIRTQVLKKGRQITDVDSAELTGILAGVLMHTLFSIDPADDPEGFARSFHGWCASFVADATTDRERADAIAGALGLTGLWTGHMLYKGASARRGLRLGFDAKPGTLALASRLATDAGQLAVSVAGCGAGDTYPEIAEELRGLADMLDKLSKTHGSSVAQAKEDQ